MTIFDEITNRAASSDGEYLCDESRLSGGNAVRIFFPENALQTSQIVKYCNQEIIPFTVYGKGTGITGGAVPFGGFVISIEKMKNSGAVSFDKDAKKFFLKVDAGVTLNDIKEFLHRKEYFDMTGYELFYPVDPTEMGASIGGTVATNASGASSFRYGPTRNWIKSLEIILPDGEIAVIKRGEQFADDNGSMEINGKHFLIPDIKMPECKNAAGLYSRKNMDLIDIFIGSEGILGIVTGVEIWLERKYPSFSMIKFLKNEHKALEFVKMLKKNKELDPVFIEYVDERGLEMLRKKRNRDRSSINIPEIEPEFKTAVFFDIALDKLGVAEVSDIVDEIEEKLNVRDAFSWCAWEEIEIERIRAFRHALPETVNTYISEIKKIYPEIHKLGTDLAVPDENFEMMTAFYHDILDRSGLNYVVFGHIGDNHLHINIIPENVEDLKKGFEIYKKLAGYAVELKGTVSAEHGIGKIKHRYLVEMYGENGISEMKRVKFFFDPGYLLNRNNMFEYMEMK